MPAQEGEGVDPSFGIQQATMHVDPKFVEPRRRQQNIVPRI